MWAAYQEWLDGVYPSREMPPEQARQLECAFFAGAAFGGRVATDHGHAPVIEAIEEHIAKQRGPLNG